VVKYYTIIRESCTFAGPQSQEIFSGPTGPALVSEKTHAGPMGPLNISLKTLRSCKEYRAPLRNICWSENGLF